MQEIDYTEVIEPVFEEKMLIANPNPDRDYACPVSNRTFIFESLKPYKFPKALAIRLLGDAERRWTDSKMQAAEEEQHYWKAQASDSVAKKIYAKRFGSDKGPRTVPLRYPGLVSLDDGRGREMFEQGKELLKADPNMERGPTVGIQEGLDGSSPSGHKEIDKAIEEAGEQIKEAMKVSVDQPPAEEDAARWSTEQYTGYFNRWKEPLPATAKKDKKTMCKLANKLFKRVVSEFESKGIAYKIE